MKLLPNISNDTSQIHSVALIDGTEFELILNFKPQQLGWFASITYGTKIINNIRVVTSGNFLYQWRNIIPFGLACVVEADQEPMFIDDFTSSRAGLYVLDQAENAIYAEVISGQISA